jgi:PDZ domain-containing protein
MRRLRRILTYVFLLGLGFGIGWIRLPYYSQGPGPAREVFPLIRFEGHPRYESSGTLLTTTVKYQEVTALEAFFVWVDPARTLVQEAVVIPPDLDFDEEEARAISQMDQSKIDAAYVVLRELTGYPREHARGALIEAVYPGCPADGKLFPGDVVSLVDGKPVASAEEATRALKAADPTKPSTLRVAAAGEVHLVSVERDACVPGDPTPYLGIAEMVEPFPFDIAISSGEVGGPSAGLMWAVGLYDLMTPADLTGGRTIAGTGTIGLDGAVGAIDGIREKVRAAIRVGATVFLVPAENMADLADLDTGGMRISPIATFEEALDALRA